MAFSKIYALKLMRRRMNTKQWKSCNLTQWKPPIHFLAFTLSILPQTFNQSCWFSLCTSNWSSRYSIRAICKKDVLTACFFLALITPVSGVNTFSVCFSFLQFFLNTYFFSHSIIIIHWVKHITTILSPLTPVFLHVGKILYLSEDKTIANVLSFMCYCIWAYRKERL